MIFSLPIVGQIGAALFASEATSGPAANQNTIQQKLQAGATDAVVPASFAQTLSSVDQAAAPQTQISTAKL